MLGAENRALRSKIVQLEQAQAQGMFLEQLTAHALNGVLASDPNITAEDAAKKALDAAQLCFNNIIAQGREAMAAEQDKEQSTDEEVPSESSLIVSP